MTPTTGQTVELTGPRRPPGLRGWLLMSPLFLWLAAFVIYCGLTGRTPSAITMFPKDFPRDRDVFVNAAIEAMVREAPSQYLWVHKRFKRRPDGEPGIY